MPSAGRTSMARIEAAPLTSTLETTLRLMASMVTIDLPSTRPTIQPAACAALAANVDASSAPASVRVFAVLNIFVAPCYEVRSGLAERPSGHHRWPQLRAASAPDAGAERKLCGRLHEHVRSVSRASAAKTRDPGEKRQSAACARRRSDKICRSGSRLSLRSAGTRSA